MQLTKVKVEKSKDFLVVNNKYIRDEELSIIAVGMLTIILNLPENWDFTIAGLVKIRKEGRDKIHNAIKELIEKGYCTKEKLKGEKGYFVYNYTFFEVKQSTTENPKSENPKSENPKSENPKSENPKQYNNLNTIKNLSNKVFSIPVPVETGTFTEFENVEIVEESNTLQNSKKIHVAGGAGENSRFSIEEVIVNFKEQGCNGQSESYANEFYWIWQNKGWEISEGKQMKSLNHYVNKFIQDKAKKEGKKSGLVKAHPAHTPIKEFFLSFYKQKFNRDFNSFNVADAKCINDIILKLEKEMKQKALNDGISIEFIEPSRTVKAFEYLLTQSKNDFVNNNLSLKLLNSKFDDVINSIRQNTNTNKQNGNKKQSSEDFRAEYNAILDLKYGKKSDNGYAN